MVDDGKQPLSADKQVIPGEPGVMPVSADDMRVSVEPGEEQKSAVGLDHQKPQFTWQRALLEIAPSLWPNVTELCKRVHVSREFYYRCLREDPVFAKAISEIDIGITDAVEGLTANLAMNPKHIIDRMAYLRARRPELYDRAKRIIVEGYKMTESEAVRRSKLLDSCVDATIVNAYTTRKERNQAKREGSSLLPSGESESGGESEAKP